jgi:hypothetical protein
MTFGIPSWKMQGLCTDMNLQSNYLPPFYAKLLSTTSSLCFNNECQWSVNNFRPCILENQEAVRHYALIMELSAASPGKNGYVTIITMSRNEPQ